MSETSAFVIFFAAIFTNNILLTNFLGMCSFIACSGQISTSLGLGTAVTFVMTMTTMLNYVIYHFVLVRLGLEHLTFIIRRTFQPETVLCIRYIFAPDYSQLCDSRGLIVYDNS
jgi:Na+-translocating ferredoxin:NAD+ oxidoreductase RnfA subunit